MENKDKVLIEKELDDLIDKITRKELNVQNFDFYSHLLNSIEHKMYKIYRQSRKCIFLGCNKQSVKKSHSIPKNSSLNVIATNGHLFHPYNDLKRKTVMKMKLVGINNASVFPGYCIEHENMFSIYEKDGNIDDEKKILLQTYRALCREIVVRENELVICNNQLKQYKDLLENEALDLFKEKMAKYPQFTDLNKITITGGDRVLDSFEKLIEYSNSSLIILKKIANSVVLKLKCLPSDSGIELSGISIDYVLPISLCGFASSSYIDNVVKKKIFVVMNVIPIKDKTYILCATEKTHKKVFDQYIDYYFQNALTIINMIESFMINGSDHWFISPLYWNNIELRKQEMILASILQSNGSFLDECQFSIFDDVRKLLINTFTKNRKLTKIEIDFLVKEKNKLDGSFKWEKKSEKELIKQMLKIIE